MKKILSIVFAALLACLAALCVVGVGKGLLDSAIDAVSPISISKASSESELDDSAQAHSEESSVCFNSMAEYIAYMTEQTNNSASISECNSVASDGNTTVYYYSPDNLPSDYEISNIIVDDTGVTFRFSKVGGVTITSNDKATMSLYNSISTRTYRDMDFITDVPTYAMELAAAIGAHTIPVAHSPLLSHQRIQAMLQHTYLTLIRTTQPLLARKTSGLAKMVLFTTTIRLHILN